MDLVNHIETQAKTKFDIEPFSVFFYFQVIIATFVIEIALLLISYAPVFHLD